MTVGTNIPPAKARRVIVYCYLAGLIDGFDLMTNGLIAPGFARDLSMNPGQVGIVFGLTSLGLFLGSIAGGRAADRIGCKTSLIIAMLLFGVATLVAAVLRDPYWFMAARLLTGLGIGGILPNLLAITSMLSTHEQASRNGTLISSAIPIGGGLAGLLIYLAPSDWSWRALLHMGGWVPVVVAGLLAWRIPDLRKDRVEGGSLLDLLSRRQRNVTIPLWLALLSMLMISYVLINWLPTLFRSMGLTGREGGLVMLFFSASGSIAVLLFGWAMKPARTLRTAMLGYAGTLLGIIALALCGPGAGFFTIVAAVSIVSFFQTGAQYLLYGVSSQGYPPALKGTGAGAALGAGRIGAAVGPAVAGLILNTGGSTHLILMAMMPVLAISACSVTVLLKSIYADRSPPRR